MIKFLELFERAIVCVLILMMMLTVFISTVELGITLVQNLLKPPRFLLNIQEMLEIFGFFLMILIGIELLETIKTYLTKKQIHVEIVFLVALIAIARKVIILDIKMYDQITLFGIATIIIALSTGYYLIKHIHDKSEKS